MPVSDPEAAAGEAAVPVADGAAADRPALPSMSSFMEVGSGTRSDRSRNDRPAAQAIFRNVYMHSHREAVDTECEFPDDDEYGEIAEVSQKYT